MIIRSNWLDDDIEEGELSPSGFYTKEETVQDVKRNFDFRRKYSNEGTEITINDSENKVSCLVEKSTNPLYEGKDIRKVLVPTDVELYSGDYVTYDDMKWIVTTNVSNNKAYKLAKISLCTITLRWQNALGDVITRYAITEDTTGFSSGEFESQNFTIPSNQKQILISYDEETVLLQRGKTLMFESERFLQHMIDNNVPIPVYEITKVNRTDKVFNGHGLITLTCVEDVFDPNTDNKEELLSNYIEKKEQVPGVHIIQCDSEGVEVESNGKFKIALSTYFKLSNGASGVWSIVSDIQDKFTISQEGDLTKIYCKYISGHYGDEIKIVCNSDGTDYELKLTLAAL